MATTTPKKPQHPTFYVTTFTIIFQDGTREPVTYRHGEQVTLVDAIVYCVARSETIKVVKSVVFTPLFNYMSDGGAIAKENDEHYTLLEGPDVTDIIANRPAVQ